MADNSHAYNSVWQLRGDAWCRLEEAADRLTGTTSSTELKEQYGAVCIDQDFDQKVSEAFHEAYMAHTSTSPNYRILASLDLGRRRVALEGVELVQRQIENAMQLRDAIDDHPLLSKYMACLRTSDLIPNEFRPSGIAQPLRSGLRNMMAAWEADEFVLDPSRITLSIGRTGYDGDTFKRDQLMDRHGVQINKTSRNTVLFMTNIGTARSSVAFLVEVLVKIAGELDEGIDAVSATFVTPYPPGFPVLVPGQVFSREILAFIRELDTPEIHGYKPEFGYRVYTKKAIATCTPTTAVRTSPTNGNGALPHPPQESLTP